ncbi:hypothetical protein FGADI_6105 [Fusarium gaditjirri]|uniref:Transcription factor domain-containing protein n=1 Tax=Fusarium gaditjirri TaxID=282569 RepID=A0A8H4T8Q2_9HYPO|nr:hypothetical protein FGADI_6105 [Fusarium gaditjirri]
MSPAENQMRWHYSLQRMSEARKTQKSVSAEISNSDTPEDSHSDSVYPAAITASSGGGESRAHEQLAYGPTSTFAFLQILHDGLIHRRNSTTRDKTQSLDAFTKRDIFFGLPYRVDPISLPSQQRMEDILLKSTAIEFLRAFEKYSSHALPFIEADKTRVLLDSVYSAGANNALTSQDKARLLMVLAIGALSTLETNTAETLLIHAKHEVVLFDDVATLPMVQFCLLMSDYQLNMGRPNAAYLQVCSACTRAIATFDCILGNVFPTNRYENTRKLHLRSWGVCGDLWFGPSPTRCQTSGAEKMAQLFVCNIYYHFIHTIYRPFLIAESALRASGQVERANAIWLRQSCRYATDAAEDSIVLTYEILKASDAKGKLINAVEGYIYGPLGCGMEDPSSHTVISQPRNPDQAQEIPGLLPWDNTMNFATSSTSDSADHIFTGFLDLLPFDPSFVLMAEGGTDMAT